MKRIIKVKDVINSKFAIKEDKGRILYKLLQESLGKNEKIICTDCEIRYRRLHQLWY